LSSVPDAIANSPEIKYPKRESSELTI